MTSEPYLAPRLRALPANDQQRLWLKLHAVAVVEIANGATPQAALAAVLRDAPDALMGLPRRLFDDPARLAELLAAKPADGVVH